MSAILTQFIDPDLRYFIRKSYFPLMLFDLLPGDVWYFIGQHLDLRSIGFYGFLSQKFYQVLVETGHLWILIKSKLEEVSRLDLSHYSNDQLRYLYLAHTRSTQYKYRYLSAGGAHSLLLVPYSKKLSEYPQGQVHSFGANSLCQLGLGHSYDQTIPIPIDLVETKERTLTPLSTPIIAMMASTSYSLILDSQGQVYGFGDNSCGRIGLELAVGRWCPCLLGQIKGTIAEISTGIYHSLFLNSQGQVLSCGNNEFEQLGLGHNVDKMAPTLINIATSMTAISAGDYYSLILSSQGQVYSFGYNDCGQLGLGDRENRDIPTLISLGSRNNDPIVAISAGCHHSLILTSRGQVYSFGRGEYGQLGTGFISNQVIPSPILNQNIGIIVALAAGESQSLILNSQGQVYSFGDNPNGELGLKYGGIGTHLPTLIETVEGLDGQEPIGFIMAMAAGEHHSFLLDSRGRVFSFGINHSGQLGLGDKMCRFTPTLVRNLTSG